MKNVIIGLLFVGGLLMAQEPAPQPQETQQKHLSDSERRALRTQSPPVKTHSKKHSNKPTNYQVTKNKTTITATKPYEGNK